MNLLDQLKQKGIEVKQIPTRPAPNNADDMNNITIKWEGPFTLDDVINELNRKDDYGLYQIYGTHIILEPDGRTDHLLNIGMTGPGSTFSKRFEGKKTEWIWYNLEKKGEISIHIARLCSKEDIELAEKLEIYWHSPLYNAVYIDSCPRSPLVQIVNKGERGRLLECIHNNPPPWY